MTFEQAAESLLPGVPRPWSPTYGDEQDRFRREGFLKGAEYARDEIADIIENYIPDMHEDDDACEDCVMVRSILNAIKELT